MSSIFQQCLLYMSELSLLAIKKGYCFFRYQRFIVFQSVHMVCRKKANKIFFYILVLEIFNCRLYLKIWYCLKYFASCRANPVLFLCPCPCANTLFMLLFFILFSSALFNSGACLIPSSMIFFSEGRVRCSQTSFKSPF